MVVDDRLEVRITSGENGELARRAEAEGVTKSDLIRRGLRMVLGKPVRLEGEDSIEVVNLRRRINAIVARLDTLDGGYAVAAIRADLKQAHADARALLGR